MNPLPPASSVEHETIIMEFYLSCVFCVQLTTSGVWNIKGIFYVHHPLINLWVRYINYLWYCCCQLFVVLFSNCTCSGIQFIFLLIGRQSFIVIKQSFMTSALIGWAIMAWNVYVWCFSAIYFVCIFLFDRNLHLSASSKYFPFEYAAASINYKNYLMGC